jgi:hypothetical protein
LSWCYVRWYIVYYIIYNILFIFNQDILYYTYIIYYIILSYSSDLSSVLFSSSIQFSSSSDPSLIHSILVGTYIYLFISLHSHPIYLSSVLIYSYFLIHSILVGTYIYLFIFQTHLLPNIPKQAIYL